jgi:hypothetical protein
MQEFQLFLPNIEETIDRRFEWPLNQDDRRPAMRALVQECYGPTGNK